MSNQQWRLKRAGFINYWNYDEQTFEFSDGKMLVRGANGSGKSVTTQSIFPFLLDGSKNPSNFDPFGSKARTLNGMLLGDYSDPSKEKTGYLWLEYYKPGTGEHITTGAGLRAKPGKTTPDFWGFVILNKRIGKDIELTRNTFDSSGVIKLPLQRKELTLAIGHNGQVVDGQKEYMELVNAHIFGFPGLQSFNSYIKLMIKVRGAKLSNDFRPSVIYDILTESLPELTDEDLRTLSETIDDMDQIKRDMNQTEKDLASVEAVCKQYEAYNIHVITGKANALLKERRNLKSKTDQKRLYLMEHENQATEKEEIMKQIAALEEEEKALRDRLQILQQHEVFNAARERSERVSELQELEGSIRKAQEKLKDKMQQERSLKKQIDDFEEKIYEAEKKETELLDELDDYASSSGFEKHDDSIRQYKSQTGVIFQFDYWRQLAVKYQELLNTVLEKLRAYEGEQRLYGEKEKQVFDIKLERDNALKEKQSYEKQVTSEKNQLKDKFYEWDDKNQVLKLQDDEKRQLIIAINDIDSPSAQGINSVVDTVFYRIKEDITAKSRDLTKERSDIESRMDELEKQISGWQSKEDPEPVRHPDVLKARKILEEKGIPFVPFYQAVDFKENLSDEIKANIESAVSEMGLLDALIVSERYHGEVSGLDKVIIPFPKPGGKTLQNYLCPVPSETLKPQEIEVVLQSIFVERKSAETYVLPDGGYQIGLIRGKAPINAPQFLGVEARRRYKQQMIAELTAEWEHLSGISNNLRNTINSLNSNIDKLVYEKKTSPDCSVLVNLYSQIQYYERFLRQINEKLTTASGELKISFEKLKTIEGECRNLAAGVTLKLDKATYQAGVNDMTEYQSCLHSLESANRDIFNNTMNKERCSNNLDDVKAEVDEIKGDVNDLESKAGQLKGKIASLDMVLKQKGAKDIQREIDKAKRRVDYEIPEELKNARLKDSDLIQKLTKTQGDLERVTKEVVFSEKLCKAWKTIFTHELRLGLVEQFKDSIVSTDEEIANVAKVVVKAYSGAKDHKEEPDIVDKLNNAFHGNKAALAEYSPKKDLVSEDVSIDINGETDESFIEKVNHLKTRAARFIILLNYNGYREVTPLFVKTELEKQIRYMNDMLAEEDKKLFEQVILRSVGEIIRERINDVQYWVKNMTKLMENKATINNLRLKIHWDYRKAETEDQLGTKELVELLRKKPDMMTPEDEERVIKHFRSKIDRAKKQNSAGHEAPFTLHQIIKDILDYRYWFQFTLFFEKENKSWRELTKSNFEALSGGEKAMAMYMPLFAAVHSKFETANNDAPRIIVLDEAFAGLDDANNTHLFELIEDLGFNFIMNSQVLWGDYETEPSLAIYELSRNADVVTTLRYLWNGHIREMMPPDIEPEQESLFGFEEVASTK